MPHLVYNSRGKRYITSMEEPLQVTAEHPVFEIVRTTTGAVSIRNKVVNEIMHNPVGPWLEANALYVQQSHLASRLEEDSEDEFVIYDVGMGAAANSLAALACYDQTETTRPLRMISFERDLELLHFALGNAVVFPHFQGYETALKSILQTGVWTKGNRTWELRHGNFLETIELEIRKPHFVFFDPYSPKVNSDMWTTTCFRKLKNVSRTAESGGTVIFTYSQATRIRTAMMEAGFFVGYGDSTGLKEETTIATTDRDRLERPLGEKWFERWRKSHLRYPYDCTAENEKAVDALVAHARAFAK